MLFTGQQTTSQRLQWQEQHDDQACCSYQRSAYQFDAQLCHFRVICFMTRDITFKLPKVPDFGS